MHHTIRLLAMVAVVAAALLAGQGSRTPHANAGTYEFAPVGAIAAATVTNYGLAGAALVLADADGVMYTQGYGAYNPTTVVPIASGSKWMSGAAIMSLVDDGLLDLDAPISTYLPTWTGTKGTITTRQLFSHTSGLIDEHACEFDHTITLADCVEQIRLVPLNNPPGTVFDYGGASMKVGGRIAEVVTGQTWAQLFAERVTGPVGMTSTAFFYPEQNPAIAGGTYSTANDYTRFLRMLIRGGEIDGVTVLSPTAVLNMHLDSAGGAPNVDPNKHSRYGIGNWRDIVGPNGGTIQNSSTGAYGFSPWADFYRGYTGVFLVYTDINGMAAAAGQMQAAARAALVDTDLDEVGDTIDNCTAVANSDQLISDRNFLDQTPPSTQDDRTIPNSDTTGDACDDDDDNDGRTDANEISGGVCGIITSPTLADTDGDRVLDGAECVLGTDPTSAASKPAPAECGATTDADGDRLSDRAENCGYNTNPNDTDTDGDQDGFPLNANAALNLTRDGCEAASLNNDRVVNAGDQLLLVLEILREPSPSLRLVSMDVNKDGAVNSGDQLLLAQFVSPSGQCP